MLKWNNKIVAWGKLASEKGVSVTFTYWGETEILSRLLLHTDEHDGIRNYFFGTHSLKIETLRENFESTKSSLGERYSEQDNIELEISHHFDALSNSSKWINELEDIVSTEKLPSFTKNEIATLDKLDTFNQEIANYKSHITQFCNKLPLLDLAKALIEKSLQMTDKANSISNNTEFRNEFDSLKQHVRKNRKKDTKNADLSKVSDKLDAFDSIVKKCRTIINVANNIYYCLNSKTFLAYANRIILLDGDAGSGKSHLLCDVASNNLAQNIPTLLLLGQHYSGGSPIKFLQERLGLASYSESQSLGIVNAMAESYNSRFVILIDAINEGSHRKEWREFLQDFIFQIKTHPYLSLAISCRTTYEEFVIPQSVLEDTTIARITHTGFSNLEDEAIEKYFSRRNIILPSSPILKPEFSNPLFLKTCCDSLKRQSLDSFPKGLNSFTKLFEFYLDTVNDTVSEFLECRKSQDFVFKFVNEFIGIQFQRPG